MKNRVLVALIVGSFVLAGCGEPPADTTDDVDRFALPERLRQPSPGSREVTMEPAGTWHVKEAPNRLVAYQAIEAEIAVALGRSEGLVGMFNRGSLLRLNRLYYRQIPGFELEPRAITDIPFSGQVSQELFYQLDPDVFMVDPRLPVVSWGWDVGDVREMARRIAPFFGNFIRYPRGQSWGPPYRQYSLDEYFRIYARLFDRVHRYRRFAEFRESLVRRIRGNLPARESGRRICVVGIGSEPAKGRFYLVNLRRGGSRVQHYRDLGLRQNFPFDRYVTGKYGRVDFETLVSIDPQVIIVLWATAKFDDREAFRERFVKPLRNHPLGKRLAAVQSGNVLPGGIGAQGPISHLFQLEQAAKQLHPERFGGWKWGRAPKRPLFDRGALASILRGDGS